MDFDEYREKGKEMVDYIANYLENIRERRVFPDVTPGYMRKMVPGEAPVKGEEWDNIFNDIERVIMPGITHWQSPHMHAYFPALNSFPALLGEMISDAINCLGFTWASSPAATELESLVMDWMCKAIGLPDKFLSSNSEPYGGGVLQTTASEATYYSLLAARTNAFNKYGVAELDKYVEKSEINGRLVCYCSDQAHSSVEKAALVAITRLRLLPTDDKLALQGDVLRKAMEQDIKDGLIPFWVCATLGTTGACAFDNLKEIGEVCKEKDVWLHVDAAYAGSAFICPQFRKFIKGVENATSFAFNPSKWLMVNFDCTCFWVESAIPVHQTFTVAPLYLKHKYSGDAIDYMHWQVGLSRRFRALKLWFVLRSFGISGLQAHILKGCELAKLFESLVREDSRFELVAEVHLGLVCFKLKGANEITENLLKSLNKDGRIHVVPAKIKENYIIRFTVTSFYTTEDDITRDWGVIKSNADQLLKNSENNGKNTLRLQSSLFLANAPQTPKIVNASFLAFFQDFDLEKSLDDLAKELNSRDFMQSHLPLTPRRKPKYLTDRNCTFDQSCSPWHQKSTRKTSLKKITNIDKLLQVKFFNLVEDNTEIKDSQDNESYDESVSPIISKSNHLFVKERLYNQASLDSKIEYIIEKANHLAE